jgi:phosphohistidine phosphatase SixA
MLLGYKTHRKYIMNTSKMINTIIALSALAAPAFAETPSPANIAEKLKSGGHVIYLRHAKTESDYADQLTADTENCATQRVLSEGGWAQAIKIGNAMRENAIPVGDVTASQYCRAWQTASLAFGKYTKTADLNFEKGETYTDAQTKVMHDHVAPMLSAIPTAGTNTIIVGHDDPFEAATGIYPEPQGVAYVLKPTGDGFEIVGHINPDDWAKIN